MIDHEEPQTFSFQPEYAECIAHATNSWATLEYYINSSIWRLAGTPQAVGACMTSQMYTLNTKLCALLALLKLRRADQKLIDRVNKFSEFSRGASELRNRIIHDVWLTDNINKGKMGQLAITAPKKLKFELRTIPIDELRADLEKIALCRIEAGEIARAIAGALPTLPEMPQTELDPIVETH